MKPHLNSIYIILSDRALILKQIKIAVKARPTEPKKHQKIKKKKKMKSERRHEAKFCKV